MQYNSALTGLRGAAILPVVAFHCLVPGFSGGFYGVDLFFVLSGFLITTILKAENERSGKIDLARFYRNRLLRLTPPLFLCLAVLLAVGLADPIKALIAASYLTDVFSPFEHEYGSLRHTWSLAVEEHFYLVWPIALPVILRLKRPVFWMAVLFALATLWRAVTMPWLPGEMTYFRFDARLSGVLLGSLVALVGDRIAIGPLAPRLSIYVLLIAMVGQQIYTVQSFAVLTAVELASAVLLISVVRSETALHRSLSHPWLVRIGVLSYSLYLWHYPIAYTLRLNEYPWPVTFALTAVLSFVLASMSHHFVEAPITRFRKGQLALPG